MGKQAKVIPQWKRWWSYLSPIKIDSIASDINNNLEIILVKGQLQLCTDKAVYSYEYKYENFRQLFDLMDFSKVKGKNVLLLGLGLGSVIQLINYHKKEMLYTAIELDDEVIHLAEKYILKPLDINVQIIQTNGYTYPWTTEEKFDLICMDIFIDDWIPNEFLSTEYCQSLKDLLNPNGTVVYNTPAFNKESASQSKHFYLDHFKPTFSKAELVEVHKNYMLISNSDLLQA